MPSRSSLGAAWMVLALQGPVLAHAGDLSSRAKTLSTELAVDASANQPARIKDPFEPLNRRIFVFNTRLDQWVLKPVAQGYQSSVPEPARKGISNFLANLAEPWTAVNQLLQGEGEGAARSLERFVLNTVTTLGLGDPAFSRWGKQRSKEDFGQTLAVWGVNSGPFLMLPLRGPSTLRDTVALGVDYFGSPQYPLREQEAWRFGLLGLQTVSKRADLLGLDSLVSGDQYALVRDVYLQNRAFQVNQQSGDRVTQAAPVVDDSFGDEDSNPPEGASPLPTAADPAGPAAPDTDAGAAAPTMDQPQP